MSERYYAATRQVTGLPYRYHAYVYDRKTGKVVEACSHVHRSRRDRFGYYGGGPKFASACADRMLRKWLKS